MNASLYANAGREAFLQSDLRLRKYHLERLRYCTNGAINSLFKLKKLFQSGNWIHFLHVFLKIKPRLRTIFINLFCLYKTWKKKDTTVCRKLRFESHNSVLKTSAHSTQTHSPLDCSSVLCAAPLVDFTTWFSLFAGNWSWRKSWLECCGGSGGRTFSSRAPINTTNGPAVASPSRRYSTFSNITAASTDLCTWMRCQTKYNKNVQVRWRKTNVPKRFTASES